MAEGFQVARLIPVSGIANATEAEMRATSALLSVLTVVRDLSLAVTTPLGASTARRATVEAFIETRFKLNDSGAVVRPDGLLQVTYGSSTWRALVEVKTGESKLDAEQINSYLTVAREQRIDAVLTISNEIGIGGTHPTDGVRTKSNAKVRLAHLSWTEILASAVRAKVHRGVQDPEQAWILGELIRYLEHSASGAMSFNDMGPQWTAVRDGAREGTLRRNGEDVREIVHRWEQLMRFAALTLGSEIGVDVQHVVPKLQSEPKARLAHLVDSLIGTGSLDGSLRIPGAAGTIGLVADLRARQVTAIADVSAPLDRGSKARASWLVRQLGPETPGGTTIEAWPRMARQPLVASLEQLRGDPGVLVDPDRRETLRFRLVLRSEMGQNRKDGGRSAGFIESVMSILHRFYADVLQQVTPWVAPAPQVRVVAEPVALVQEPIADEDELHDAISAARDDVSERTGEPHGIPGQETEQAIAAPSVDALSTDASTARWADGSLATPSEELVVAPSSGMDPQTDDPGPLEDDLVSEPEDRTGSHDHDADSPMD